MGEWKLPTSRNDDDTTERTYETDDKGKRKKETKFFGFKRKKSVCEEARSKEKLESDEGDVPESMDVRDVNECK